MITLDKLSLEQICGGGVAFPAGVTNTVLKTAAEWFRGKQIPYGLFTVWGHKGHGEMPVGGFKAPPYGHPDGVHYTFWGTPAPDALVVHFHGTK